MDIKETISKLKKYELENLARQLKITGYSGKSINDLINHIKENADEHEITKALKPSWWERSKTAEKIAIFSIIGTFVTIIGVLLTIQQGKDSTAVEKKQDEVFQSISKRLEHYDPIKRDQILNQLKKVNKELQATLKDEKSGNTKERKEALKALNNGNPAKAEELFKQRIKQDKNNLAENHFNLASACYYGFKLNEALQALNKAIEIKPDFAEVWNNKGVALDDLGRKKEAQKAFNKAKKIRQTTMK